LFFKGNGETIEAEVPLHMGIGQKIVVNEKKETELLQAFEKITSEVKPFTLILKKVGDYGEDFTIFLSFSNNREVDSLISLIMEKMKPFFPAEGEKWDTLHFSLVYDDVTPENIEESWKVINKLKLTNKTMYVNSIWLWKNKEGWKPYKEFVFGTS